MKRENGNIKYEIEDSKYQIDEKQNQSMAAEVADRLLSFAAASTKPMKGLVRTYPGRYMSQQLMRSSAPAGANYEEARGGESCADFIHKLQIAHKELREARFRLKLIDETGLMPHAELLSLHREADELNRIVARSILTAKARGA